LERLGLLNEIRKVLPYLAFRLGEESTSRIGRIEIRNLLGKDGKQACLFRDREFVALGYRILDCRNGTLTRLEAVNAFAHRVGRARQRRQCKSRDGE